MRWREIKKREKEMEVGESGIKKEGMEERERSGTRR